MEDVEVIYCEEFGIELCDLWRCTVFPQSFCDELGGHFGLWRNVFYPTIASTTVNACDLARLLDGFFNAHPKDVSPPKNH